MNERDIVTIDQQQKLISKTEEKYKNTKKSFLRALSLASLFEKWKKEKKSQQEGTEKFLIPHYDLKWVTLVSVGVYSTAMCLMHERERRERNEEREQTRKLLGFYLCVCVSDFCIARSLSLAQRKKKYNFLLVKS